MIFKTLLLSPPPSFLFSLWYLFLLPSCLVPLPVSFVSQPCPFIPSLLPPFPPNVFTSFLIFSYTFIFSLHFLSALSSAVGSFLPSLPLSSLTMSRPLPSAPPPLPPRCYPTFLLSSPHFSSPLCFFFPALSPPPMLSSVSSLRFSFLFHSCPLLPLLVSALSLLPSLLPCLISSPLLSFPPLISVLLLSFL